MVNLFTVIGDFDILLITILLFGTLFGILMYVKVFNKIINSILALCITLLIIGGNFFIPDLGCRDFVNIAIISFPKLGIIILGIVLLYVIIYWIDYKKELLMKLIGYTLLSTMIFRIVTAFIFPTTNCDIFSLQNGFYDDPFTYLIIAVIVAVLWILPSARKDYMINRKARDAAAGIVPKEKGR